MQTLSGTLQVYIEEKFKNQLAQDLNVPVSELDSDSILTIDVSNSSHAK